MVAKKIAPMDILYHRKPVDEEETMKNKGQNKSQKKDKKKIVDWKVALMNASRRVTYASNASLDELSSYLDDIPTENKELSINQKLVLFVCTLSFLYIYSDLFMFIFDNAIRMDS